jgi:hypothetical protein
MKKHVCLILLALLFLCACQPTPDEPFVVSKDQQEMLEAAKDGKDNSALLAALDVPDRFSGDWMGVNDIVQVTADADIQLPDAERIPTGRVTRREFVQSDLDLFLRVFLKGNPFYEEVTVTKQEALERLKTYQAMQSGELPLSGDTTLEKLPGLISYYEELARTAPDGGELRAAPTSFVSDSMMSKMSGWSNVNGNKVHLLVQNFDVWNTAVFYRDGYGDPNYSYTQAASDEPDFSEAEAIEMGNALISELGLTDVVCDQIIPVTFSDAQYVVAEQSDADAAIGIASESKAGYRMQYVRTLDGCPIGYTGVMGAAVDESYSKAWPYETIEICVTNEGIVYFKWSAPTDEPELTLKDTQLMRFDEIVSVFERMIMVKYAYFQNAIADGADIHATIRIDQVKLTLMRIRAKNSQDDGLLIPVWDFYGTVTIANNGDETTMKRTILLSLNAIDGSLIDRETGC